MFSLDNFYLILSDNLLMPIGIKSYGCFYPFGAISAENLIWLETPKSSEFKGNHIFSNKILFFDQEPLLESTILNWYSNNFYGIQVFLGFGKRIKIFANSDISQTTKQFCKDHQLYNWYYFFHGFASLDWYRDYQYLTPVFETQFSKVFISLNHLMTKNRSYRLNLVANYIEKDIISKGVVSLPLYDQYSTIKGEVFDSNSLLSLNAKKLIARHLIKIEKPFIAGTDAVYGGFSAKLSLALERTALWNVVSETIFYHDKLHLTEKIFKPIVACRPFILVGAPGNLAYLKSYGFKTFDRWIDESYDLEQDPDLRIGKITDELKKLCSLSIDELRTMEREMRDVLEHNFYHFYGDFKKIIVNELVDNFELCLRLAANGEWREGMITSADTIDYNRVKQLLLK
jgi:hypothetical protein